MKRELFVLVSIISIIMLTSCVSNPAYINKYAIDIKNSKIAVLPFRDYSIIDGNNSGELVRSTFEQKLLLKGFSVIEIEKISSTVDYSFLNKNEYPGSWIIKTGNQLGVDYMIYGSVNDYRVYQNLTSFLYIFSWLEVTTSVGVTARMVSCKTGEVVWYGSYSKSSYTLNDAASEVVYALIRTIKRNPVKSE